MFWTLASDIDEIDAFKVINLKTPGSNVLFAACFTTAKSGLGESLPLNVSFLFRFETCDIVITKFVWEWIDGLETVFGRRYIESAALN